MAAFKEKLIATISKHSPELGAQWVEHNPPCSTVGEANRFLRIQLGLLSESTTAARECLVDDITERDWVRNFNKYVAPVMARCGVPAWN